LLIPVDGKGTPMATPAAPRPVIRRLTDIADPDLRKDATLGVQITLEANLAHLRSIKDTETKWLELYAILAGPATGYVMGVQDTCAIFNWPLVFMLLLYLALTAWLQNLLLRERFSYYSVLRSVIRSQNLLGLFDISYLSEHFANSAFPAGLGPNPAKNGTQPLSSFLRRMLYVFLLYLGLLLAAFFRWCSISPWFIIAPVACLICEFCIFAGIFWWDKKHLVEETEREAGLAGYEDAWFPKAILVEES
jgi:hypothetical protein